MTLFMIEAGMPGFERGRNLKKLGMKSQDTAELFFNDVKVPPENVLGQVDFGFYYLMQMLAQERNISGYAKVMAERFCPLLAQRTAI